MNDNVYRIYYRSKWSCWMRSSCRESKLGLSVPRLDDSSQSISIGRREISSDQLAIARNQTILTPTLRVASLSWILFEAFRLNSTTKQCYSDESDQNPIFCELIEFVLYTIWVVSLFRAMLLGAKESKFDWTSVIILGCNVSILRRGVDSKRIWPTTLTTISKSLWFAQCLL